MEHLTIQCKVFIKFMFTSSFFNLFISLVKLWELSILRSRLKTFSFTFNFILPLPLLYLNLTFTLSLLLPLLNFTFTFDFTFPFTSTFTTSTEVQIAITAIKCTVDHYKCHKYCNFEKITEHIEKAIVTLCQYQCLYMVYLNETGNTRKRFESQCVKTKHNRSTMI